MFNASRLKAQFTVALAFMASAPYSPRLSDFPMRQVSHHMAGVVIDLHSGARLSELSYSGTLANGSSHVPSRLSCRLVTMLSQYCQITYFLNRAWELEFEALIPTKQDSAPCRGHRLLICSHAVIGVENKMVRVSNPAFAACVSSTVALLLWDFTPAEDVSWIWN